MGFLEQFLFSAAKEYIKNKPIVNHKATNDFIGGLLDELIEEDKKNTELQNLINSRILYNVRYESSKTSNNIKESTNIYIFNMMII
ncbi:hypothetical protein R4J03_07020 [Brachyspira intermedia]|uniref:hypothetical protein n=1 Tax=Brachyspira intermedia TaxID=84377 RepID=UPI0026225F63|nr:hypothetical protein [uncultured Brachyspira sp.]